jgi:hypothetical protein
MFSSFSAKCFFCSCSLSHQFCVAHSLIHLFCCVKVQEVARSHADHNPVYDPVSNYCLISTAVFRYVSDTDDRDFVDRLHCFFTTNILIALSVLVSFKQFGKYKGKSYIAIAFVFKF